MEQNKEQENRPTDPEGAGADQAVLCEVDRPIVGNTVFIEPIGNNARRGVKGIQERKIEKVGKKYIYIENMRNKFFIDTLLEDCGGYCSGYRIWLNKSAYDAYVYELELNQKLFDFLSNRWDIEKIALDKKKRILEILEE